MVALQIISKVLESKDISIIEDNLLTEDYFVGFEGEYEFIMDHYEKYGIVPDKATFLGVFDDMELVEVTESDEYLVNTIREENLYYRSIPVVKKIAELLKSDANAAVEYMHHSLQDLHPNYAINCLNVMNDAKDRNEERKSKQERNEEWMFTTGFKELDNLTGGFKRGEEFVLILARINQGKSWILEKIISHIWEIGFNVGYVSPEMSGRSIGYRFDTLHGHFSNTALVRGTSDIDEEAYEKYVEELGQKTNKFMVATPLDFGRHITVSKLRNWIKQYKLDAIGIDGITYIDDERYKRGDTKNISLTNISEDLMKLSNELHIPIIAVVQANRSGVVTDDDSNDTPELEHARDSDGMGANASIVISIRQQKNSDILILEIKKQRSGVVGKKLLYHWNIDTGTFTFIEEDSESSKREQNKTEKRRKNTKTKNITDAF